MAKKIVNKSENTALQGANVLAAQSIAVSPLAAKPVLTKKKVNDDDLLEKQAVQEQSDSQSVVIDDQSPSLDTLVESGVVDGGDMVLAQANGASAPAAGSVAPASGSVAPAAAGMSTGTLVALGAVGVAAAAGGGGSSAPPPTYAVTKSATSVNEGDAVVFTVATTGLAAGTKLTYILSGVSAADVVGGSLTGEATVGSDGKAYITVSMAADATTEAVAETLTITVAGASASVVVQDTSIALRDATANSEVLNGGSGADTFTSNPVVGGMGALDTYIGDTINGGGGEDTLNIVASSGGFFSASSVENINIRTMDAVDIDMSGVSGLVTLTAQSLNGALVLDEVQGVTTLVYKGNAHGVDSDLTVNFAPENVDGVADLLEITAEDNSEGGTVTINGIETVSMTFSGTNVLSLSSLDSILALDGEGGLELTANDVAEVNNAATGAVTLSAALATAIENSGEDLTVESVANEASVTNSGAGAMTFDATADDVTIVNSGSGVLTVAATGVASVGDVTIINSGTGNTTIEGSAATVINTTGEGDLTVEEDAFAATAVITSSGSGALTVTVKDNDVTIDASASTGDVTVNVTTGGTRNSLAFTGSDGDDKVVLGAAALVAGDLLDGGDGDDTIEVGNDDTALDFTNFLSVPGVSGVTGFETVRYTGTDAVTWTALESLGTTVELEFGAVGAVAANGVAGVAGTAGVVNVAGGDGADGGTLTPAEAGTKVLELSGTTATINVVLTENLSSVGGNGGAGGAGGAGYVGNSATAATGAGAAAQDGTAGGNGGAGEVGGAGETVLTTDATTFSLTLNGVTLNSSGGHGGAGGAGANGGHGGAGFASGANANGGDGGAGGNGGVGGAGGDAATTVVASSAKTVNIHSNVSDTSTVNELLAAGGQGGVGGAYGSGGLGGAATASGSTPGMAGVNGTAGAAGASGLSGAGLWVADTATITIDGEGDLTLGLILGDGLTIDASELTGDLTLATEDGDDTITGGAGANTITLFGGVDNVDISLSAEVADTITVASAAGTDMDFVTAAADAATAPPGDEVAAINSALKEIEITGFEVGTDTIVIAEALAPNVATARDVAVVANTNIQLTASDTVGGDLYSVYQYIVTDGVVSIGKAPAAAGVSASWGTYDDLALFEDAFNIIFNDVLDSTGIVGTPSGEGESVIWTDGTDSWVFVSDGIGGFSAGDDYVIRLVGVVAETNVGIIA